MGKVKGTPAQGLAGATPRFFIGFAAVALFGPTAARFQQVMRLSRGLVSDKLREGGENTAILALFIMLMGALLMISVRDYQLPIPGEILLAFGMGICNAAVFKMAPQAAPKAVGGAAGWVGGLGAFGGFAIPPMLAFAVRDLGKAGYSIGFVVYLFLALLSLFMAWILKYSEAESSEPATVAQKAPA